MKKVNPYIVRPLDQKTHDDADGVWFLSLDPTADDYKSHYLVVVGRDIVQGESMGYAILFHDPRSCRSGSKKIRADLEAKAEGCMTWLSDNVQGELPATEWADPPSNFTLFLTTHPTAAMSFRCDNAHVAPELATITQVVIRKLTGTWLEWAPAQGDA